MEIPSSLPNNTSLLENVSRETLEKLHHYDTLIHKWNPSINLVSSSSLKESWKRHILDSVQLTRFIPSPTAIITDLGSGGGLPGIVLAILLPEAQLHLIESDQRKCAFLRQACAELKLSNAEIHNSRIEKTSPWQSDIVTSRALASLKLLIHYAKPFMNNKEGKLLFLKGKNTQKELSEALSSFSFSHKTHSSTTEAEGKIIEISDIAEKNEA